LPSGEIIRLWPSVFADPRPKFRWPIGGVRKETKERRTFDFAPGKLCRTKRYKDKGILEIDA